MSGHVIKQARLLSRAREYLTTVEVIDWFALPDIIQYQDKYYVRLADADYVESTIYVASPAP